MEATGWTLLTLLSKVLIYIAGTCVVGGLFALWMLRLHNLHKHWLKCLRVASVLGMLATIMNFLIQIGSFADEGIAGIWDRQIATILIQTGVGDAALARLSGFMLIFVAGWRLHSSRLWITRCAYFFAFIGCVSLLWSYTPASHLSDKGWLARDLLAAHLLGISLWLGSLYPLWHICRAGNCQDVERSLRRFGQMAAVFVSTLLACGIYMALILLADTGHLFATPYGRVLLVKMLLVGAMLGLAAGNAFWLVPRFQQPQSPRRLRRVITAEALLGVSALIATGFMTTYTGPEL